MKRIYSSVQLPWFVVADPCSSSMIMKRSCFLMVWSTSLVKCKPSLMGSRGLWSTTWSPSRVSSSCGCMSIVFVLRQMLILPFNILIQICCKIFSSIPIIWISLRVSLAKATFWCHFGYEILNLPEQCAHWGQ